MNEKRWLSPAAAAAYLDVRVDALPRLVKSGRIPAPYYQLGPRSPRYDRLKLDEVMDGPAMEGTCDPDKAFEIWLAKFEEEMRQKQARKDARKSVGAKLK